MEEDKWESIKRYLNTLRDTGKVNVFGAGPYLQRDFGLSKHEAEEAVIRYVSQLIDLSIVIDELIKVIPPEEDRFIQQLKDVQGDCVFTASEAMHTRWKEVYWILVEEFPADPHRLNDWQTKFIDIWRDSHNPGVE